MWNLRNYALKNYKYSSEQFNFAPVGSSNISLVFVYPCIYTYIY